MIFIKHMLTGKVVYYQLLLSIDVICTSFELILKGDKSFSVSNWGQKCGWSLSLILIVGCRSHIDDDDFNPKNSKNVSKRIEKKNFSHLSENEG